MATWCTIGLTLCSLNSEFIGLHCAKIHLLMNNSFCRKSHPQKCVLFSISGVCSTMAAQQRAVIGQVTVSLLLEEFHAEVCPVIPVVIKYQVTFTPLLHHTFAGLRRRGRHRRACSCCAAVDASSTLPAAMHHSRVSSWQSFE